MAKQSRMKACVDGKPRGLLAHVDFGKAPRDNMTEAIHTTLDRRTDRLADLCRGWIDFLFAT